MDIYYQITKKITWTHDDYTGATDPLQLTDWVDEKGVRHALQDPDEQTLNCGNDMINLTMDVPINGQQTPITFSGGVTGGWALWDQRAAHSLIKFHQVDSDRSIKPTFGIQINK